MNWLSLLTIIHVGISLVAIVLGIPATNSIIKKQNRVWSVVTYYLFTALTTLTGFAFPIVKFTPGIAFGLLTVLLLVVAGISLRKALANNIWHFIFLLSTLGTLYLNCVVLFVQSFQKIAPLKLLAPTQSEPPFVIAQSILFLAFFVTVVKGYHMTFHPKKLASNKTLERNSTINR